MKKCLLAIAMLWSGLTFANEAFEQANQAYEKGEYTTAIQQYEALLPTTESSNLYFNLGNAHYKNQDLGKAMLYWSKAKRLAPNNGKIKENIAIGRSEVEGDVIPIAPFFLSKIWTSISNALPSQIWAIMGLLLLFASAVGGALRLFAKEENLRKKGLLLGIIALVVCIFPFALAFTRSAADNNTSKGVLLAQKTQLHPNPDVPSEFFIYEGTELEVLDQIGAWHKVRLLNSDVGWIKADEYELVNS